MKDVTKTSTKALKYRYGQSNGKDRQAEDELRRRGLNSIQLRQVVWDYGGEMWGAAKKKANAIVKKRKRKVKQAKNKRHAQRRQERRRQEQIDRVARMKEGIRITGKDFDPSASDGSCPF
jgi:hypothetical protein